MRSMPPSTPASSASAPSKSRCKSNKSRPALKTSYGYVSFRMPALLFCYNFAWRFTQARNAMISLFGKPEPTLAERLKASVSKTKAALSETVDTIFLGEKKVDPALLKQLENALLSADLGVGTTREILDAVREKLDRNALSDSSQLKGEIKSHIVRILNAASKPV